MIDTITTAPAQGQQKDWAASPTEFAVIIDAQNGKLIGDFASPHLHEEECLANFKLGKAAPKLLRALVALRDEVTSYGLHHPEYQAQFSPDEILNLVEVAIAEATDDSIGMAA